MNEHEDDCRCEECEAEAQRLRLLLLDAVRTGKISETALLDTLVRSTDRPEIVAMVEDYRIQQGGE
jgi:hypothetical protein